MGWAYAARGGGVDWAVVVRGVAVGLRYIFWRARRDGRDREKEDQIAERC